MWNCLDRISEVWWRWKARSKLISLALRNLQTTGMDAKGIYYTKAVQRRRTQKIYINPLLSMNNKHNGKLDTASYSNENSIRDLVEDVTWSTQYGYVMTDHEHVSQSQPRARQPITAALSFRSPHIRVAITKRGTHCGVNGPQVDQKNQPHGYH